MPHWRKRLRTCGLTFWWFARPRSPNRQLIAGALKLVVRAGAGYNTIDVAAASRRGIYVSNCPGKNSVAVAELAFGLMLSLDRRIPDNVADLARRQMEQGGVSRKRADYLGERWG